jgi:hypothetical protein
MKSKKRSFPLQRVRKNSGARYGSVARRFKEGPSGQLDPRLARDMSLRSAPELLPYPLETSSKDDVEMNSQPVIPAQAGIQPAENGRQRTLTDSVVSPEPIPDPVLLDPGRGEDGMKVRGRGEVRVALKGRVDFGDVETAATRILKGIDKYLTAPNNENVPIRYWREIRRQLLL